MSRCKDLIEYFNEAHDYQKAVDSLITAAKKIMVPSYVADTPLKNDGDMRGIDLLFVGGDKSDADRAAKKISSASAFKKTAVAEFTDSSFDGKAIKNKKSPMWRVRFVAKFPKQD